MRVYRIQRDIPMPLVSSGVEKGNLRELALARMQALGLACRDVRTREAGIVDLHHQVRPRPTACFKIPSSDVFTAKGLGQDTAMATILYISTSMKVKSETDRRAPGSPG